MVTLLSTAACSDDDVTEETEAPVLPVIPDEAPGVIPVDDSPFCRAMLDLGTVEGDDLPGSGTATSLDDLLAAYVDVQSEVPSEIRPDFDVVLERLVAITSGDDVGDPQRAEESAIELSAYIERQCRGTSVSPLPPPTAPGDRPTDP